MAKFKPGVSGNPKGRPVGALDWRAKLRKQIQDAAPDLINTVIRQASEGDTGAARVLLDRILPAVRPMAEAVTLPEAETGTMGQRAEAVLQAVAAGRVDPRTAGEILGGLATAARIRETEELARRLEEVEARLTGFSMVEIPK
jgi:hypothetical protein